MARPATAQNTPAASAVVTVALCYLVAIFEGFDLQAAGVAAPGLRLALGLSSNNLGWFFSVSTFGLMLGAGLGGRLSDHFGRKRVIVTSVIVFGIMSVFTGLAADLHTLFAARFFTGLGIGAALPNLVALTAENAPPARRNLAVGLLYAGLPSGGALASLTTLLGAASDWRAIFFVGGAAPLIAVPLLLLWLPESRELEAARTTSEPQTRSGFSFALFGESRAARTVLLWVGFFLSLLTMYLLLNWLPTLLIDRGLSRANASLVQVAFNSFGAIASALTGLFMDRVPLSVMVGVAFGSAAVSLLLLAYAPPELIASVAVGALVGITMSATQTTLYAIAPRNYPTRLRGTGVGSAVSVGRLGSAVGPLLAAGLLGSGRSPQEVLMVLAPTIVVSGLAVLGLSLLMRKLKD